MEAELIRSRAKVDDKNRIQEFEREAAMVEHRDRSSEQELRSSSSTELSVDPSCSGNLSSRRRVNNSENTDAPREPMRGSKFN